MQLTFRRVIPAVLVACVVSYYTLERFWFTHLPLLLVFSFFAALLSVLIIDML